MKLKKVAICMTFVLTVLCIPNTKADAASNMVPNYEVKLLLDSEQVLNSDDLLKKTYRTAFDTGSSYNQIGVLYVDTTDKEFNAQGWTNRIRIKEDADKFELTYKKRYSVSNGNITAALNTANTEGFDITDTNYDAQVDWGYSNMTLSLSCQKEYSNKGYDDLELPKKSAAISILASKMPGKEDDWLSNGWGTDLIQNAKKYGPVFYEKYGAEYNGIDVDIEIWPLENSSTGETEYITEISFKADTYTEASSYRTSLINYLDDAGILLHTDSLKTTKILSYY